MLTSLLALRLILRTLLFLVLRLYYILAFQSFNTELLILHFYEGHSKMCKSHQERVSSSRLLFTIFNIVPVNNTFGQRCSCIAIPSRKTVTPCASPPPNTPLQHRLLPIWRPGRCDLSLGNK